jgi:hypothetical protein
MRGIKKSTTPIVRSAFALAEKLPASGLTVADVHDFATHLLTTHLVRSDSAIAGFMRQQGPAIDFRM